MGCPWGGVSGGQHVTFISNSRWLCFRACQGLTRCVSAAEGWGLPVPDVPIPRALSVFSSLSPTSPLMLACEEGTGMSPSDYTIYKEKTPTF